MQTAEGRLDGAISYTSLVRYDAYGEMSGRQSMSIALLDSSRTGIVLSAIHHRDQARLYAKRVSAGHSELSCRPRKPKRSPARWPTVTPRPTERTAAMRIGYFGPEGTYTQEAMLTSAATLGIDVEAVPLPTIYDTVMAVHDGTVERALVPIENSLEGSVNATLDALAHETERVEIVGEVVMPIRHCLIVRAGLPLALDEIETVVSHPQANAQCAQFIRTSLPQAQVIASSSTAEAVRTVAGHDGPWAALGNRMAAEHYGCVVLAAGSRTSRATKPGSCGWPGRARKARQTGRALAATRSRPRSCSGARAPNGRGGWSHACRRSRSGRQPDPDRVPAPASGAR